MATQNSFFRRFAQREPDSAGDDPANLGTAFGLDASLDSCDALDADDYVGTPGGPRPQSAPMDWLGQRRKLRR